MQKTAKARYEQLVPRRESYLQRARQCASLTLPSLMPPLGWNGSQPLPVPYQGLGARGVVNLASRLMMTLLPPGQRFFRLEVPTKTLIEAGLDEPDAEITNQLVKAEQLIQSYIQSIGWRQQTNLSCQLLAVTGNVCEFMGDDGRIRLFRLDQYVVERDVAGNLLEFVLQQKVHPTMLPEAARQMTSVKSEDPNAEVEVYTWVKRMPNGRYGVKQEIEGTEIPGSRGVRDKSPFNPLRWNHVPGDDYGRGKVEEHLADLTALDVLTKSILDGADMASKNITRISPDAPNYKALERKLKEAKNGDVLVAGPDDVGYLQFNNIAGLQTVSAEVARLTQELGRAFMMTSGIQRDAERVTATELRMAAEELEGTLGGVYSMLSDEMQRNRIENLIGIMQNNGALPAFDEDMVQPVITTGLEALGRERDVVKITQALQYIPMIPPEETINIDFNDLVRNLFTALDLPGSVRPKEQVDQMRQQRQIEAAMAQGAAQPQG